MTTPYGFSNLVEAKGLEPKSGHPTPPSKTIANPTRKHTETLHNPALVARPQSRH